MNPINVTLTDTEWTKVEARETDIPTGFVLQSREEDVSFLFKEDETSSDYFTMHPNVSIALKVKKPKPGTTLGYVKAVSTPTTIEFLLL